MRRENPSNEPSQRQLRVGEQLKHLIAETLQRGHFHEAALLDIAGITVTEVRATPDLKQATAYVMSLGGEKMGSVLEALNRSSKVFQKDINRHSNLKFTPRITFKYDETYGEAQRIEELLHEINKDKN
jgi:ribosome-binding factor A